MIAVLSTHIKVIAAQISTKRLSLINFLVFKFEFLSKII